MFYYYFFGYINSIANKGGNMKYSVKDDLAKAHNIYEGENQAVTHLNIKKGEEIPVHKSPMSVIVVIYEGEVEFSEADESYTIIPGDIVELKPNIDHALKANLDSKVMVVKSELAH